MKALVSILLLLLSTPCRSTLQSGQAGAKPGRPVQVKRLRTCTAPVPCPFSFGSGLDSPQREVVRDREAWSDMWKRIYDRQSPLPELPEVDFSKEMVVVAAMGSRPTGGYMIVIEDVREQEDRLEVIVRSHSPGRGCLLTQSLTQPVDIVIVPKSARSVVFTESEVVHDCN